MKTFSMSRLGAALCTAGFVMALGATAPALAFDPAAALKDVATMLPPAGPGGEKPVTFLARIGGVPATMIISSAGGSCITSPGVSSARAVSERETIR